MILILFFVLILIFFILTIDLKVFQEREVLFEKLFTGSSIGGHKDLAMFRKIDFVGVGSVFVKKVKLVCDRLIGFEVGS